MRGGKRAGAGRKPGSCMDPAKKKKAYNTKLRPDLIAALKAHELPAAQVIDKALRVYLDLPE